MGNRTIIYGGSFDPVHKGHIDIIRNLCSRFDRVIVVPCALSPFKHKTSASASDRLTMLNLALGGLKCEVSDYELTSDSPSYSYLTAKHYSDSGELSWAVGSEMTSDLAKWKNFEELKNLVKFYVIPRPHFSVNMPTGASYELADFVGGEQSSSALKIALTAGDASGYLTPEVEKYIKANGLYQDYFFVRELYQKYRLSQKRIRHSYSTALCGVNLAKRMNIDTDKAAIALLLHDIGKYITLEEAQKMGIKFTHDISQMPESIRHAEIGAEILAQKENICDNEIIQAVRWHTTGKPNMSPLETVVFLADFIEPLRDFSGVDRVRQETDKSITGGLIAAFEETVKYLPKSEIYHTTLDAYEYYTRRNNGT